MDDAARVQGGAVTMPDVDTGLVARVTAVAQRLPHAPAVMWDGGALTYRELESRANRLAQLLRARGITAEVPVAVGLPRGPELVIAVLAVLKAGGAYVPLDAQYPPERLQFMVADSGARVVLTTASLAPRLGGVTPATLLMDSAAAELAAQPESSPPLPAATDALTYVIYTSGSTGQPKGVAMAQRALVNLIAWQVDEAVVGEGARTLQFAPISFDVSFQELFSTWCAGGTLVLVSEDDRQDFGRLLDLIAAHAVARLFLPFVALHQLAETAVALQRAPSSLREIITAGEQLQITPAIASWFRALPGCRLSNQYGPSETHVVTAHPLAGPPEHWPVLPPIGRPIRNVRIELWDAQDQPVPAGAEGELVVGGVAVARGYLNRPDLSAARFLPDPAVPGGRLYRTGDLARRLPDGSLEFLGRVDAQVKIRGYRVELGEIESALRAHPAVLDAAVTVREDAPGDKRLAAYVVARGEPASATTLRTFIAGRLPDYMQPAVLVHVPALPLTPSGKVDRRALPPPDRHRPELPTPFVPPRPGRETELAALWADLLRLDRIGVDDNFFELGGNSLLAMQLRVRLQTAQATALTVARLFEHPTVRTLAAHLEGAAGPGAAQAPAAVERAQRQRAAYAARRPGGSGGH